MEAFQGLASYVGVVAACKALSLNRAFVYRDRARRWGIVSRRLPAAGPRPPLAHSSAEQDLLLGLLNSERFADVAPASIFASNAL